MARRMPSPVQWFGGKGLMVGKLLPLVPYGKGVRIYVEPYCGGASLFFAKKPHPIEVLNDLDHRLIALFRTLQDKDEHARLRYRLLFTPYARAEFERALDILQDPSASAADTAWALFVVSNQGFSGRTFRATKGNWGRSLTVAGGVPGKTSKWIMRLSFLNAWHRRLLPVHIECRDALEVIRYWDSPETVFYIDPPYVPETRADKNVYLVEPDLDHHVRLVEVLLGISGFAIVSGYRHPVYRPLEEAGWKRRDFRTACYAAGRIRGGRIRGNGAALRHVPRTESVWVSPRLLEYLALERRASRANPKRRGDDNHRG